MAIARYNIAAVSSTLHIYSRGVEKRLIFLCRADYKRFLERLFRYSAEDSVRLYCVCLMPNHFHLVITAENIEKISRLLHRLLTSYSMYFNLKYDRSGHLFGSRFYSKAISNDAHLEQVIAYVKANPGRQNYPWLFTAKDCP